LARPITPPPPARELSGARRVAALLAASTAAAFLAAGCGRDEPDLVNGKALFIGEGQCGSCHTLERAGTMGAQGPNLDDAFGPARGDGLGKQTIAGIVHEQIEEPREGSMMPEDLVTGDDARDVAAYVAEVAGMPGEDTGALATAGLADATEGEQIFTAAGCGGCHTFTPAGTSADIGPNLDELASVAEERGGGDPEAYVEESILEPDAEIAPGFEAGVMPANYAEQLQPEQVDTLVQYLLNPEG
jgi:mono/diheme cytochrome c family protein